MILVADSGSSKTDWILALSKSEKFAFNTRGINPFFLTEKDISKILQQTIAIQPYINQVSEIYFFGAGCSSPDKHEIVSNGLSAIFPNAFISVDNDILGSAYATCGANKGITCILGTGSNITYFNGKEVIPTGQGLGFILGDEGSGTDLGKRLITDYLYGLMPETVEKLFNATYHLDKEVVIKNVYQEANPNLYLAAFTHFLSKNLSIPYIQQLVESSFQGFIDNTVKMQSLKTEVVCHFVGSIAFHFKSILQDTCSKNNIMMGKVLKQPIEELFSYITKTSN